MKNGLNDIFYFMYMQGSCRAHNARIAEVNSVDVMAYLRQMAKSYGYGIVFILSYTCNTVIVEKDKNCYVSS